MQKKVLVTGAAGFIGFHLSKSLKERGDEVIGYDNFNTYYSPALKEDRAALLKEMEVNVIRGDICDAAFLNETIKENEITHIAHLAAQAGVRYSLENPQAYIHTNIEGFTNILEICRSYPTIKLVYASSSSVYGLNEKVPFSETDRTDNQASLYGATKKSNELFAFTYHHLFGISVTGLRFFTVYGPWGRPDMAYYSFTDAILKGEKIDIYNFGKMKRDFTYIDDVVTGTKAALDLGADCELFNLGNHQPVELMEFIRVIEDATGRKAQIDYMPMQMGDVPETFADIQHSKEKLNYFPRTSLETGIPQFVEWFESYHTR
jgi:UDP-glucuronate 4-epimerase